MVYSLNGSSPLALSGATVRHWTLQRGLWPILYWLSGGKFCWLGNSLNYWAALGLLLLGWLMGWRSAAVASLRRVSNHSLPLSYNPSKQTCSRQQRSENVGDAFCFLCILMRNYLIHASQGKVQTKTPALLQNPQFSELCIVVLQPNNVCKKNAYIMVKVDIQKHCLLGEMLAKEKVPFSFETAYKNVFI